MSSHDSETSFEVGGWWKFTATGLAGVLVTCLGFWLGGDSFLRKDVYRSDQNVINLNFEQIGDQLDNVTTALELLRDDKIVRQENTLRLLNMERRLTDIEARLNMEK